MAIQRLPLNSTIIYDVPPEDEAPELPIIIATYKNSPGVSFIANDAEVYAPLRMIPEIVKTLNRIYKENAK